MKLLLPKSDFCLKELFENEIIRTYFVSDVLGIPLEEIRSVKLRNPLLRRTYRRQKLGILDVLIELNDDTKINIEIQLVRYKYWDRSGHEFSDMLELHTIELRKKVTGDGDVENWIRFFNAESEADLRMIETGNAGILEAIRELKRMSLGERIRARYEAHLKAVRDYNAAMDYARDSGMEAGRLKGRLEGKLEGEENGIRAIVRQCTNFGADREQIIKILMQDFNLEEADAIRKYEQYSR
ncbi:MAG: PD-(D/E)XK nuclease family transposase [Wujia sp.]